MDENITLLLLALALKLHFYQGDRKVSPTKTISSRGGAASITTIFLVAQIQDFGTWEKDPSRFRTGGPVLKGVSFYVV